MQPADMKRILSVHVNISIDKLATKKEKVAQKTKLEHRMLIFCQVYVEAKGMSEKLKSTQEKGNIF